MPVTRNEQCLSNHCQAVDFYELDLFRICVQPDIGFELCILQGSQQSLLAQFSADSKAGSPGPRFDHEKRLKLFAASSVRPPLLERTKAPPARAERAPACT